jgi:hypothetical protein
MRNMMTRIRWWTFLTLAGGMFFLNGCDPTLQSTIEDGIITTSSSFIGSLFRALIELASETTTTTT